MFIGNAAIQSDVIPHISFFFVLYYGYQMVFNVLRIAYLFLASYN